MMTKAIFKSLTRRLFVIEEQQAKGAELDSHFDGGEWSGPAHGRIVQDRCDALLAQCSRSELECVQRGYSIRMNEGDQPNVRYTLAYDEVMP